MTVNGQALWVITDAITRSLSHPKPSVAKINLPIPRVSPHLGSWWPWTNGPLVKRRGQMFRAGVPRHPPDMLMTLSVALKCGGVTYGSGDVTSRSLWLSNRQTDMFSCRIQSETRKGTESSWRTHWAVPSGEKQEELKTTLNWKNHLGINGTWNVDCEHSGRWRARGSPPGAQHNGLDLLLILMVLLSAARRGDVLNNNTGVAQLWGCDHI